MAVEYRASTVTNMDSDNSKIGYEQFFGDGSKLQFSVYTLRNSPFRVASLCLGLLCVFLLAGVIGQSVRYQIVEQKLQSNLSAISKEKENLQQDLKMVQKQKNDLDAAHNRLQQNVDFYNKRYSQVQTNNNLLTDEVIKLKLSGTQLQTTNNVLTQERDQLKASNDQFQTNTNTLNIAKDLVQKQCDSAIKLKKDLQVSYDTVVKDRDNLQNKYNNVSRAKEQLQKEYISRVMDIEHLENMYNFSNDENEELANNHQNLTAAQMLLQARFDLLVKATDELRAFNDALTQEKNELENSCDNATAQGELLKMKFDNLTAERDLLQAEVDRLMAGGQDRKCPTGWKKFQQSCYYVSTGKKSWMEGRQICKNKGADLAIIKTQDEMNFIDSLFLGEKEVWIGLTDEGVEGQWKWVDGTKMNKPFWGKDQPNSHVGRNQDCVEFWHHRTGVADWNDENCNVEQNWICEM